MTDTKALTVAEAEQLVDEAASRIRNILDKLHGNTGFALEPNIDVTIVFGGRQFFIVNLNAKIGGKRYIPGLDE